MPKVLVPTSDSFCNIPEFYVNDDGSVIWKDGRSGEPYSLDKSAEVFLDLPDGSWFCLYEDRVNCYKLTEERDTIVAISKMELSKSANQPLKTLDTIRQISALLKIDVFRIIKDLKSESKPGESLNDTFSRILKDLKRDGAVK